MKQASWPLSSEKLGMAEATETAMLPPESVRRSSRSRSPPAFAAQEYQAPGADGMKAAHQYLDGTFASPGESAIHWGVDRQLVNYYVRKLVAQGVPRSERSSDTPRSLTPAPCPEVGAWQ